MHELSIAHSIIEVAKNHLVGFPNCEVRSIRLKIGALSCVHRDALHFSFDLIAADTPLQGAQLIIDDLPVVVFCPSCDALRELPGIQRFVCPVCDTRTGDIRQGKELEIDSIEVVDQEDSHQRPSALEVGPEKNQCQRVSRHSKPSSI
ncbi:MAG TPA: hydrogenase maturation nickel metallochaperone HypA [Pirellulaceae bacterium]|nr:hydrogenase maturation nickel metallochaperone HypA [Pirellulaceae bacterium]HMO90682.1 hydrogenase maturation nickel metallochaperone HypA [Pirellulaceae bacterium]HMP67739.1 hydrogenase maturation nickel metallochaperone HypA [Pirellulaceae bacterium]